MLMTVCLLASSSLGSRHTRSRKITHQELNPSWRGMILISSIKSLLGQTVMTDKSDYLYLITCINSSSHSGHSNLCRWKPGASGSTLRATFAFGMWDIEGAPRRYWAILNEIIAWRPHRYR